MNWHRPLLLAQIALLLLILAAIHQPSLFEGVLPPPFINWCERLSRIVAASVPAQSVHLGALLAAMSAALGTLTGNWSGLHASTIIVAAIAAVMAIPALFPFG